MKDGFGFLACVPTDWPLAPTRNQAAFIKIDSHIVHIVDRLSVCPTHCKEVQVWGFFKEEESPALPLFPSLIQANLRFDTMAASYITFIFCYSLALLPIFYFLLPLLCGYTQAYRL